MSTKKAATIFDHLSNITDKKKDWNQLTEADQKSFAPYIINRWLSMHYDLIEIVDMFQQYTIGPLDRKHVYQLYHDILPAARMRAKYIKGKKMKKFEPELIKFMAVHFELSEREVEEYLTLWNMSSFGKARIQEILRQYGKSDKEIKKLLSK